MDKKNILIYGAGNNLTFSFYDLDRCYHIAAIMDGNVQKIGQKCFYLTISGIEDALKKEHDYVVITPANVVGIKEKLIKQGADKDKLISLQEALNLVPDVQWDGVKRTDAKKRENPYIAVVMCGGMGDLLIGRVWLESVIKKYQIFRELIEIYLDQGLKDDGAFIFMNTVPKENIYTINTENEDFFGGRSYDTVLRFCIVPEVCQKEECLDEATEGSFEEYVNKLWEYGKKHYNRGFIAASGYCKTIREVMVEAQGVQYHTAFDVFGDLGKYASSLDFCMDEEKEDSYLREMGLAGKRFVTLNTGLNAEYRNKKNTRAWAFENWSELARELKKRYPNIAVVQVGIRMRDEDDIPADLHMNGRTTLEQISYILKKALVHVDYDGGLVHVRHLTGGKSIVLMGSSAAQKHAYPENVYIQTDVCEPCEWSCAEWLSVCSKGYDAPLCMTSITVDMVMEEIEKSLEEV